MELAFGRAIISKPAASINAALARRLYGRSSENISPCKPPSCFSSWRLKAPLPSAWALCCFPLPGSSSAAAESWAIMPESFVISASFLAISAVLFRFSSRCCVCKASSCSCACARRAAVSPNKPRRKAVVVGSSFPSPSFPVPASSWKSFSRDALNAVRNLSEKP